MENSVAFFLSPSFECGQACDCVDPNDTAKSVTFKAKGGDASPHHLSNLVRWKTCAWGPEPPSVTDSPELPCCEEVKPHKGATCRHYDPSLLSHLRLLLLHI